MAIRHSEQGQQMPATVCWGPDAARLTVVLALTDDVPPAAMEIEQVEVELLYPSNSENYGKRQFRSKWVTTP